MSADSRALLPMLWLLASEYDDPTAGIVTDNIEKIAFRLRINPKTIKDALNEIQKAGFIQLIHECNESVTLPLRIEGQFVTPETEKTDTERYINTPAKVTLETLSVFHVSDWLAEKRTQGKYLTINESALLEYFKDYCRAKNPKYKDYVAAFRNSFNWQNAPTKGKGNENTGRPPTARERTLAAANRANAKLGLTFIE